MPSHGSAAGDDTHLPPRSPVRLRVHVRGTVQGVGFRAFVYRLAERMALGGFVLNDDDGVLTEVEGPAERLRAFTGALRTEAPAAARVDAVEIAEVPPQGDAGFTIRPSAPRRGGTVPVSPDLATCADCWAEFRDPADRRYRYPFLNCTACGPRYTIVRDVPYDRARTTMAGFTLCADCRREYETVGDRRYHAQPIACPACGPVLQWRSHDAGDVRRGEEALTSARAALARGDILAVKGLGGYHLLCDARNDAAVTRLRTRKHRPHQPLAVLVADVDTARSLAEVSDEVAALLQHPAAPIVLLPARANALAPSVAPGVDTVGLLCAYTPLHALLAELGPLVCTSGNLSGEPITWRDDDALERLAPLVDGWLLHDRPIAVPCDDSVLQADPLAPVAPVRRSRGYAPMPVALPGRATQAAPWPNVLAVGAELKATLAATRDASAFLSGHLGDVGDPLTLEALALHATHLLRLHGIVPERVACDAHPGYLSARWAAAWAAERGLPLLRIQHHHAHLAALQAEHRRPPSEPLLAVTFDGTGYGPDGTIWGGEFLFGDCHHARRAAHLRPFPLPGGDAAVRQPARVALAMLHAYGLPWDDDLAPVQAFDAEQRRLLRTVLTRGVGTVSCTSMGRLFDVCAALLGVQQAVSYEGQAAVEFTALAMRGRSLGAHVRTDGTVRDVDGRLELDPAPMLAALVDGMRRGVPRDALAYAVHAALADAVATVAEQLATREHVRTVGLTGGVFQNRLLLALCREQLQTRGLAVRTHAMVPCNDGGLALGQAVIARHADLSQRPTVTP